MDFSNYKFGLRGHDIANNFDDMCRIAKETGVPNLQFALARTVNTVNFDEIGYDDALAKDIKSKLDAHNLSVSVLGCYINPIDQNPDSLKVQLKRFENFIRYAAAFDARVIGTETGSLGSLEATRSEENYQFLLSNLRPLVKVAEECGVTMAIEPVWQFTIYSVEVMKRLLDDINSDNLGVILENAIDVSYTRRLVVLNAKVEFFYGRHKPFEKAYSVKHFAVVIENSACV